MAVFGDKKKNTEQQVIVYKRGRKKPVPAWCWEWVWVLKKMAT